LALTLSMFASANFAYCLAAQQGGSGGYGRVGQSVTEINTVGTGSVRACIRRMAGCATPIGFAGHAPTSAKANSELTFHLDHRSQALQADDELTYTVDNPIGAGHLSEE
jgi:hypothetical protein